MAQSRKQTAYRKSRKFGDVHGGRSHRRITDGIYARAHSLKPPGPTDSLPIVIEENPSRRFFFPISGAEAREAILALPKRHHEGLTHIWLRRATEREIRSGKLSLAEFICGSGVRVIVLYPWSKDRRICLGRRRPSGRLEKSYAKFGAEFIRHRGWWYAQFGEPELRRFYVEHLLYHEVGHHVDWYRRHWSAASRKAAEEAADQYAVQFAKTTNSGFNRLQEPDAD